MKAKRMGLAAGLTLAVFLTLLLHTGLFTQFGQWLRTLSLSGRGGNAGAWTIVLLLSALPGLGLLRRRRCGWDWLLLLGSLQILAGLYFLVNPGLLSTGQDLAPLWSLAAAGGTAATLLAWAVLRGLDRLGKTAVLGDTLASLLNGAGCLLPCLIVWNHAAALVQTVRQVAEGNTAIPNQQLFPTYASLTLLAVFGMLPALLGCLVLLWGGDLARAMEADPFGAETVRLAEKLSLWCARTAAASVLTCVTGNAFQMLFFSSLQHISSTVSFPAATVLLSAALGLLCRYIQGAKAVSDDNESII